MVVLLYELVPDRTKVPVPVTVRDPSVIGPLIVKVPAVEIAWVLFAKSTEDEIVDDPDD